MTVSEGRRMHTESLRRIINLLKGRPNIKLFLHVNMQERTPPGMLQRGS